MKRKHPLDMTKAEYQAYVKKLEKRYSPDKAWKYLPISRKRGRPKK